MAKKDTQPKIYDLTAKIKASDDIMISPNWFAVVELNHEVEVPEGHIAVIVPDYNLARNSGITLLNSPTIVTDNDDKWEAILVNHGNTPYRLSENNIVARVFFIKPANI